MNIDDSFNGITILNAVNRNMPRRRWRYYILRDCCGKKTWIGHNRLLIIKRMTRPSICRSCDEQAERRRVRRTEYLKQTKKSDAEYVPGWGFTLGKMGKLSWPT